MDLDRVIERIDDAIERTCYKFKLRSRVVFYDSSTNLSSSSTILKSLPSFRHDKRFFPVKVLKFAQGL